MEAQEQRLASNQAGQTGLGSRQHRLALLETSEVEESNLNENEKRWASEIFLFSTLEKLRRFRRGQFFSRRISFQQTLLSKKRRPNKAAPFCFTRNFRSLDSKRPSLKSFIWA